jgi:hypothetical protein
MQFQSNEAQQPQSLREEHTINLPPVASGSGGNVNTPLLSDPMQPFSSDFIQSGASSWDDFQVDPSIFRPDSGLNFERDFGQWFTDVDLK